MTKKEAQKLIAEFERAHRRQAVSGKGIPKKFEDAELKGGAWFWKRHNLVILYNFL